MPIVLIADAKIAIFFFPTKYIYVIFVKNKGQYERVNPYCS